jgi:nicotinamidase-related amidase
MSKNPTKLTLIALAALLAAGCGAGTPAASPSGAAAPSSAAAKPASAPASASPSGPASKPAAASAAASASAAPASAAASKPAASTAASAGASTAPDAIPAPKPVTVDAKTTSILVLDTSARCDDPKDVCSKLVPVLKPFLDKARARQVFIVHTVSASAKGTTLGAVSKVLEAKPDEPVLYPDGFDKFVDGELQKLLAPKGIKTLAITGSSTNVAVLHTTTGAARNLAYQVVIPEDGANASNQYEHDYALHQMSVLPNMAPRFTFTTLNQISFG